LASCKASLLSLHSTSVGLAAAAAAAADDDDQVCQSPQLSCPSHAANYISPVSLTTVQSFIHFTHWTCQSNTGYCCAYIKPGWTGKNTSQ